MQTTAFRPSDSDQPVEVTIARQSGPSQTHGEARIGDRTLEFELMEHDARQGTFVMHGRVVRYFVARRDNVLEVWVGGRCYTLNIAERVARRAGGAQASAAASNQILAPMPGTILKMNVEPGAAFVANEPIIVMESMKMEMTLTSPAPGRLAKVHCKIGQLVDQGALLATLELDNKPE